tara:strand:- start:570 stop:728 length:159 start_codon:yes stop_codon:yes gene_type:complete
LFSSKSPILLPEILTVTGAEGKVPIKVKFPAVSLFREYPIPVSKVAAAPPSW